LRHVLIHVQKVDHGWDESDAPADAEEAHQHANAKSQ
jgi:hypothetical protein